MWLYSGRVQWYVSMVLFYIGPVNMLLIIPSLDIWIFFFLKYLLKVFIFHILYSWPLLDKCIQIFYSNVKPSFWLWTVWFDKHKQFLTWIIPSAQVSSFLAAVLLMINDSSVVLFNIKSVTSSVSYSTSPGQEAREGNKRYLGCNGGRWSDQSLQ